MRALISLLLCAGLSTALSAQPDPGGHLLDVSIGIFDMNLPQTAQEQQAAGIYPAVRQAESRYLPAFLKQTLQESGRWGAVRILPGEDTGAELQISASIIKSDGAELELQLLAQDSTGRIWVDKDYLGNAVESVSLNSPQMGTDPFFYLYGEISNDLNTFYDSLTAAQIDEIKAIALLRYGASLAPDTFQPYLEKNEAGLYTLNRFPAENDPFLSRVKEIREHEYVFIDVVDEQYQDFFVSIKPVYDLWRRYRRDEQEDEINKINQEARQGNEFRRGSYMALRESYNNFRWAKMQEQYLDEMSEGFSNEILPTDIKLEDSLYHLTGTIDQQYEEWRNIMRELYQLENP